MLIRNRFCLALVLFICLSANGSAAAFDLEKRVIKTRLPNGLTVLMLERHFSPTVSLYIRHRVGAVDEVKGQSGAAHFLEHMMFKGTPTIGAKNFAAEKKLLAQIEQTGRALDGERRKGEKGNRRRIERLASSLKRLQDEHRRYYVPNEIDRLYTENGGLQMNASTGQDVTTYFVNLPANKIELWARIESDRLLNPVFRDFYTERDVILEERRQTIETSPDGKLFEAFLGEAYRVHPYGVPIIGLPEDLRFLNPQAIRHMHKKYLRAEHMVIAVVGDIDPDKTLALINRYFGRVPRGVAQNDAIPAEPPQREERKVEVPFDANPSLAIGFHKPAPPSDDDYALDVLETILSKGRTSRLYAGLVLDKKIADSISVHNGMPAARYPNLFTIFARPRHPHTNDELLDAVFHELEDIRENPVSERELAKAKNQMKMDYIRSLDSNAELASILSYYELLLGNYRYFSTYLSRIHRITAQEIQKAAQKYLVAENRTIAVLIPPVAKKKVTDQNEQ
ncbi:MAG: insulinase family protein [Deltaproteobacteria bacterium]|nr:insulinase family protein [Deltaproteobacteria bacterium]